MGQFNLADEVETPDGIGDVRSIREDGIKVSLNDTVEPEHAIEKTAPHEGVYRREDCEKTPNRV